MGCLKYADDMEMLRNIEHLIELKGNESLIWNIFETHFLFVLMDNCYFKN